MLKRDFYVVKFLGVLIKDFKQIPVNVQIGRLFLLHLSPILKLSCWKEDLG